MAMKAVSSSPCTEVVVPIIGPMYNEGRCMMAQGYQGGRSIPVSGIDFPVSIDTFCDRLAGKDRFNLNLLLHSRGGDIKDFEMYKSVVDITKDRGGLVRAYVPNTAGSAAAFLMTLADQRLVHRAARIVFHIRAEVRTTYKDIHIVTPFGHLPVTLETTDYIPVESFRAVDRGLMRRFLIDGVREEIRRYAEEALNRVFSDPNNPRDELTLTGSELGTLGKAEVFAKERDLKIRFMNDTGIKIHSDRGLCKTWQALTSARFLD